LAERPSSPTALAVRIELVLAYCHQTPFFYPLNATIADASTITETRHERSLELALAAARTAEENRGGDIAVLDMRGITPEFDYFVLATGNSRRQLHAISEEIDRVLEGELSDQRLGIEGYSESRWILLDYGSVVIHLFDAETRGYYALEDLWGSAQRVPLPWQSVK
jgi:ribosome-associated protein